MNQSRSPESQIVKLCTVMAERENRLRLSYGENLPEASVWPVCSGLLVQADLLRGLAREWKLQDYSLLADRILSLAALGQESPELLSESWNGAMQRLAAILDQLLAGLSSGDSPAEWLSDSRWERLASWFEHLDSPFLVLDEMEEILRHWQDSWCDASLESSQEAELRRRWLQLRDFGDALLGSPSTDLGADWLRWK